MYRKEIEIFAEIGGEIIPAKEMNDDWLQAEMEYYRFGPRQGEFNPRTRHRAFPNSCIC